MKPSEALALKFYEAYLKERHSSVACVPCPEGYDPPDLICTCDRKQHAVEVTELHQYLNDEDHERSRETLEQPIRKTCKQLERELGSTLHRRILVYIQLPISREELKSLSSSIKAYVNQDKKEREKLFGRRGCYLESLTHGSPGIALLLIPSPTSTIPESDVIVADIQASVDYAVDRILRAKLKRLKGLRHYDEIVLIVFSENPLCSVENIQCALDKHEEVARIATGVFFFDGDALTEVRIQSTSEKGLWLTRPPSEAAF